MMTEIERKFLVDSIDFIDEARSKTRIVQGYLNTNPERTVRIRIKGNRGFITVKGKSNETGTTRFEWEKEIPINEIEQMLPLCEEGVIEKDRYEVLYENHLFEIDVFGGKNKGLILAEIELNDENENFEKPTWLGKEVTKDKKYYNSFISQHPFQSW